MLRISGAIVVLTLATACTHFDTSAVQSELAAETRSEADRQRDATSKPLEVLKFFGLAPGDTVLDLFAGAGYYSQLAAAAVGADGRVYAHNNAAYLEFAGEDLEQRLATVNTGNLIRYDAEIGAIDLPDNSVDVVLMILTYHDIYYVTDGWALDGEELFGQIRRVLKPDGVFGIVDHAGRPGSGSADAQTLHRIDAEFARRDIESHGFRLTASTDVLNNPDDDPTLLVFDPSVRGTTSRFVYRFELVGQSE